MPAEPSLREAAADLRGILNDALEAPTPWAAGGLGTARAYDRFFENQGERLRLSFGSVCARRLWYSYHEPHKAVPPDGAARVMFAFGDVLEALLLSALGGHLEALKGPWSLDPAWAQKDLTRKVQGTGHAINGHPDGLLLYNGNPYAIVDSKSTTKWSWGRWEDGRKPDPVWGYRHQAANYVFANEAPPVRGFLWLVGILDNNRLSNLGVGWMTKEELASYAAEAEALYHGALLLMKPPPPAVPGRDDMPCAGKTTKYCRFHEHCTKDTR